MQWIRGEEDSPEAVWTRFLLFTEKALLHYISETLNAFQLKAHFAEDLLQETCAEAWQKRSAFHGESPAKFYQWLASISRFKVLNLKRQETLRAAVELEDHGGASGDSGLLGPLARDPSPEAAYAHKERKLWVARSLATLPDLHRRLVVEVFLFGVPVARVARAEGLQLSTARKQIHRALEHLRPHLRRDLLG